MILLFSVVNSDYMYIVFRGHQRAVRAASTTPAVDDGPHYPMRARGPSVRVSGVEWARPV